MSSLPYLVSEDSELNSEENLPIAAMVRAVCKAAHAGPEMLYEVMLKLSLMVEATVPTYGLSIWTLEVGQKPKLKWAEGLEEQEIAGGEQVVAQAISGHGTMPTFNAGDQSICFVLA